MATQYNEREKTMSSPYSKITISINGETFDMNQLVKKMNQISNINKSLLANNQVLADEVANLRQKLQNVSGPVYSRDYVQKQEAKIQELTQQYDGLAAMNSEYLAEIQELEAELEETKDILFEKSEALNQIYNIAENFAIIS